MNFALTEAKDDCIAGIYFILNSSVFDDAELSSGWFLLQGLIHFNATRVPSVYQFHLSNPLFQCAKTEVAKLLIGHPNLAT